jgi:hypothetical protein
VHPSKQYQCQPSSSYLYICFPRVCQIFSRAPPIHLQALSETLPVRCSVCDTPKPAHILSSSTEGKLISAADTYKPKEAMISVDDDDTAREHPPQPESSIPHTEPPLQCSNVDWKGILIPPQKSIPRCQMCVDFPCCPDHCCGMCS